MPGWTASGAAAPGAGAGPIGVERARAEVLAGLAPLGAEQVPLGAALGRRLAADAVATAPVQAFDNSAMDGYALRAADAAGAGPGAPAALALVGESRAGHPATAAVGPGEAIAISTGAMLPAGADAVARVEDTHREGGTVLIEAAATPGLNVRRAGEDFAAGATVLARRRGDRRRRARRPRLALARPGGVRAAAAGRGADQRRRADAARRAAPAGRDPRLEQLTRCRRWRG